LTEDVERATESQVDRISLIKVDDLFGLFDHVIPLDLGSGVTIIHGPNGVGKTIVLRMIDEVFSGKARILKKVPYSTFTISFHSGDELVITSTKAATEDGTRVLHYRIMYQGQLSETAGDTGPDEEAIRQASMYLAPWSYEGGGKWRDPRDGEIIDFEELHTRQHIPPTLRSRLVWKRDPLLEKFSKKCRIRLISTDRLTPKIGEDTLRQERLSRYNYAAGYRIDELVVNASVEDQNADKAISFYSADLRRRVQAILTEYGRRTESLDRSLVRRLIRDEKREETPDELVRMFKQLDQKRRRLTDLGLLNVAEDLVGVDATEDEVRRIVSASPAVFSVYVRDMQQKLALFDGLQSKMELLRGRTDERFQFKRLIFNPQEGFIFRSDSGEIVAANDLSSGEQHEIVMLYEILFLAEDYNLILIDEPEISLHLEWQMEFLEDLSKILREAKVDILMATHSAAIARAAKTGLVRMGRDRVQS